MLVVTTAMPKLAMPQMPPPKMPTETAVMTKLILITLMPPKMMREGRHRMQSRLTTTTTSTTAHRRLHHPHSASHACSSPHVPMLSFCATDSRTEEVTC